MGHKRWRGYFIPCTISYAGGLFATMVALVITGAGQPALLYLVPATLGTTITLAYFRNDLQTLWDGLPESDESMNADCCGATPKEEIAMVDCPNRATFRPRKGQLSDIDDPHDVEGQLIG